MRFAFAAGITPHRLAAGDVVSGHQSHAPIHGDLARMYAEFRFRPTQGREEEASPREINGAGKQNMV